VEWLIEMTRSVVNTLYLTLVIIGVGFMGAWAVSNLPDGRQKER